MNQAVALVWIVVAAVLGQTEPGQPEQAQPATEAITIQLQPPEPTTPPPPLRFTARVTPEELAALLELEDVPLQFRLESQRQATLAALDRIGVAPLLARLDGLLSEQFADRFNPVEDLILVPVPEERQVSIDAPDVQETPFRGPGHEVKGFLLHNVTESEFVNAGIRIIQTARLLADSGDPIYDRTTPEYFHWLAAKELEAIREARARSQQDAREREEIRRRVAAALGLKPDASGAYAGEAEWLKESRRFSYIVKEGNFIQRLEPLVQRINREMTIAGFAPPSELDEPGIHYDPEIGDVDIVLPKPMLGAFLAEADTYERRMAEDAIISIEAVRLTDRDIISGALASRLNAQIQGVHDPESGFQPRTVLRELGLNALLAVANQDLQVRTLEGIAAGELPEGVQPVQIAAPTLPPIEFGTQATTIGSTFSVGADPIFFDGREQVYGFSYIGPDGLAHTLDFEVVDSLRETWERIERNLIVHKIKKTETLTPFSVPVGPETKTYNGIAALISQQNEQLVVATGTGAISEISATAGTWLIIEGFEITPIPGSSTTLTEDEIRAIESRVLLTMFLRDPRTDTELKQLLLETRTGEDLRNLLLADFERRRYVPIRPGRELRTYGSVFEERYGEVLADDRVEKKERNSVISLTFYSSQGNIVQTVGTTQLGDANDLTSFTTELRPNVVTPISSFFTKVGGATTGSSPLTGANKGEQTDESKSMTHLVIRARFPTIGRERADREEGRYTGYFELPVKRQPASQVDLPFLSSSEHPAERLAKLRVGLMFPVLDPERIRKPFSGFNPQRFPGDVPPEAWETATTRMLMVRKIIGDSPGATAMLAAEFGKRFILEVRSLLEFDEDFFNAPGIALRNMTHWNNPDRIVRALHNSPHRFPLERLVSILDELGTNLVPDEYAADYLALSPPAGWGDRRIFPLTREELTTLRRDVAAHYLRHQEAYGDAFLEAASRILRLGSYQTTDAGELMAGPFRGYRDLVVFDQSGSMLASPELYILAHKNFILLKSGGYRGKLFEPSLLSLEHLPADQRRVIYRGTDILALADRPRLGKSR